MDKLVKDYEEEKKNDQSPVHQNSKIKLMKTKSFYVKPLDSELTLVKEESKSKEH